MSAETDLAKSDSDIVVVDQTSTVIATGVWCEMCEFFETADVLEDGSDCAGCGCDADDHVDVAIVKVAS